MGMGTSSLRSEGAMLGKNAVWIPSSLFYEKLDRVSAFPWPPRLKLPFTIVNLLEPAARVQSQ